MATEADGDRVIEIVSAGALYRGGESDRKYWSCTRGKDRYPYPVGYHAVRHFSGISYTMQIQQGPRGPIFQVTSTEGDSSAGQTPVIAWKNFQKKSGAKVRNWQRRMSFPQKIDGVELFGFKNASVQRLLRELVIDSSGAVELNLHCPATYGAGSPLTHKVEADISDAHEDLSDCLGKTGGTAKRSMNLSHEEGTAKRVHYQDILTSVDDELDKSAHQSSNKGGPGSRAQLQDVSGSRCMPPLLEEIPCDSKCTLVDDYLGEYVPNSSQEDCLSSGSYLSSEKSDLESAEKEVAKSMMTFLLPQAIPLLKKTHRKKKVKQKRKEEYIVSMRTVSAQNPSADGCQGVTVPTIIGEGTNRNSSQTHVLGKTLCEMVKDSCANDEPVSKLDEMKAVVADSFEDDAQIWGDNTSKPMGSHHHESDENSKLLHSKREDHAKCSECQVGLHDSTKTPDILYDHEKGQYVLSDSLLACLEEEFGGNSDVEQTQVEQHFKEPTNGINNGSSISMDGPDHKNFGNGLSDVCGQASARHGSAISSNGECLANVLQGPLCSNAHNDTEKSPVFMTAAESKAKSPLRTEVASVDQNKHKFHGVNYTCRKFDDPLSKITICRDYDDTEFVDKFVAFESLGEGKHSKDGSQRVNTIAVWPVDDGTKSGKGNPLDKGEECQAGCRNDNENTMMSVSCESNVCEHIPPKGENIAFHHYPDHDLSSVNHLNDLLSKYPETSARGSDYHLDLMGSYLHPMPVLSITLNTKNNSSLHIYVLCGFLESCQRFLYVYNITPKGQETPPYFIGYTPLQLPSLEQSSTGNFAFGRSGLQFTLDGQFLVLPSSIRIPCCRTQSIDCSCSLCKSDQCEDNSLKIVSVNFGYVSLLTKLVPYGTVSCILICEPNYVVAAEDSRNLHIWMMSTGWSVISEEYVIPSLGNVGPSILELRRMPKSSFLIIGHDGAGGFCLWDFSKRTLLATFAAPGNIVFQILPVGFCSLQEDIIHASVDDIERRLREITVKEISGKADKDSILMSPGKDIAIWILVSSASVAEYQHDLRGKEHNARWKLALLAKKRVILGNILDPRATVVDASGNCGFAGTYEGLLYTWELSSGRKLAGTQCFNGGRISCIAVDAKSGVVAVADDGCQLLLYTQNKVLSNARAMSTCSG